MDEIILSESFYDLGTTEEVARLEAKTVTITKKTKTKFFSHAQLVVDPMVMEDVFGQPDVVNKPVALYGIAGSFRQGKSFLFNLLYRYLTYAQDGKEKEWLLDPEDDIGHNFNWRGGHERHTEGIVITRRPFFLPSSTNNTETIAVFLMDTQGVFDNEATQESDKILFALSCLVSSFQMFNLSKQINGSDLQHLTVFSEFGKMAREQNKSKSVYQTLQFLVRDWDDEVVGFGLKGGLSYLQTVFGDSPKYSIEHKSVCKNVKVSFETTECFVLPEPGKKVRRKPGEPQCSIKEIDEEFLEYVDELAHHLFDKPIPKQMNGVVQRGSDMINLSLLYSKKLSGRNISAELLYEANAELTMAKVMGDCEKFYQREIAECRDVIFTDEETRKKHQEIIEATLKHFDNQPKIGEDEFILSYRGDLAESCNLLYYAFQHQVRLTKLSTEDFYKQRVIAGKKSYQDEMNHYLEVSAKENKFFEEEEFTELDRVAKNKALAVFHEIPINSDKDSVVDETKINPSVEEIKNKHLQKFENEQLPLQKDIVQFRNALQKENIVNEMLNRCGSQLEEYDKVMSDFCDKKKFHDSHEKLLREALLWFDRHQLSNANSFTCAREVQLKAIEVRKKLYEKTNSLNLKLKTVESGKLVSELKTSYKQKMTKVAGSEYVPDERFNEAEVEVMNKCLESLHETVIHVPDKVACNQLATQVLGNEQEKFMEINKYRKDKQTLEQNTRARDLKKRYVDEMLKLLTNANNEEFFSENQSQLKEKLQQEFDDKQYAKEPLEKHREISSDLLKAMNTFHGLIKKELKQNLIGKREVLEKLLEFLLNKYNSDVYEFIDAQYADAEDFTALHKEYKAALKKQLASAAADPDLSKEFQQRLEVALDRSQLDWCRINQLHKKFYTRKVTRPGSKIGAIVGGVIGLGIAGLEIVFVPGAGWALGAVAVTRGVMTGASLGNIFNSWMSGVVDYFRK